MSALLCLLGVFVGLLGASAEAAKVPATVNIGIGPTVGTVVVPGLPEPVGWSVGLSLQAEGHVTKKTLSSKAVQRRIPRKYKGLVRNMDDLHVSPLPTLVIPDQSLVLPLRADAPGPSAQGVGWTPISLYLLHKAKPAHLVLGAAPRVGWVHLRQDPTGSQPGSNHLYLGLDLNPEWQSPMKKPLGMALGANAGPGLLAPVVDEAGGDPDGVTLAVWADAYLRVHLRTRIQVSL